MSSNKHQPKWPSFVIALFLILTIVSFFFEERAMFDLALGGISFFVLIFQSNYIFKKWSVWLFIFLLATFTSFMSLYLFQHRITTIQVRLLMNFTMLMLIVRYGMRIRFIEILLWGYIFIMSYLILFTPVKANDIFPSSSANFVGWLALVFGIFYYLLESQQNIKTKIFPALGVLIFALICLGRSTILASTLMILAVLVKRFFTASLYTKSFFFVLIAIFISYIFLSDFWQILELINLSKFQKKGFDMDGRELLITAYLEKIDFVSIFTGISPNQWPFTYYNQNFHNSYILAHSNFGVWAIIGFILLSILILKGLKKNAFIVILLITFLARIFTDTLAFVGPFDFIFFYGIFYLRVLLKNKKIVKNEFQRKRIIHYSSHNN